MLGRSAAAVQHVAVRVRTARIVLHDVHLLLADHVAAEVLLEIDGLLQSHAEIAGLIVSGEELGGRIHFVDALPTASAEGFQKRGKTDVAEDLFPVERIDEIAHGLLGGAGRMRLCGRITVRRNGDADLRRERVVEEFVVGAPPERVVDDAVPLSAAFLR
jgi:hypothetical protein